MVQCRLKQGPAQSCTRSTLFLRRNKSLVVLPSLSRLVSNDCYFPNTNLKSAKGSHRCMSVGEFAPKVYVHGTGPNKTSDFWTWCVSNKGPGSSGEIDWLTFVLNTCTRTRELKSRAWISGLRTLWASFTNSFLGR